MRLRRELPDFLCLLERLVRVRRRRRGGGGNQCYEYECEAWCGGTGSCFNGVCYCGT